MLSINERTRELGMLRAIGTSRRQVRRMIRYEAVITALIGAVLGPGARHRPRGLRRPAARDDGFVLSLPGRPAARHPAVLAALAGVLAAIAARPPGVAAGRARGARLRVGGRGRGRAVHAPEDRASVAVAR